MHKEDILRLQKQQQEMTPQEIEREQDVLMERILKQLKLLTISKTKIVNDKLRRLLVNIK